MREEIESMEDRLKDDCDPFDERSVVDLCSQLTEYSTRTARQMTSPAIRDDVVARFGHLKVASAAGYWRNIRGLVDVRAKIVSATEHTASDVPDMKPYLVEWHQIKAAIALEIPQKSSNGPFNWDPKEEYLFPDELARQGLNELLLLWLDRYGLAAHM